MILSNIKKGLLHLIIIKCIHLFPKLHFIIL